MIRFLAGLIAAVLLLAQPGLAQEPPVSASIVEGTCGEAAAVVVAELQPPVVPEGPTVGANGAQTAGTSFTTVPLPFETLIGADHAITVTISDVETACGEIGGIPAASGSLSIVLTAAASGVGGIAYIQSSPGDPSATDISIFVGGGTLDGIDDASVARSGADPVADGTPTPSADTVGTPDPE